NGGAANAVTVPVVAATVVLGVSGVLRAAGTAFGTAATEGGILAVSTAVAALLLLPVLAAVRRGRASSPPPSPAPARA
ncbi:MAG TPA: hypothetical protein VHG91_03620, partial [Longimicrobium sp.]|nr:hypothetical protein [Longimicrobium sp.]